MFRSLCARAAVATVIGAGGAQASSVDVTYQVPGTAFGSDPLRETVSISTPNDPQLGQGGLYDGRAPAGRFQLAGSGGLAEFAAFCVELAQALQSSATYTVSSDLFEGRILQNIDRLFSSRYAQINTTLEAAAFQVALWEIVHETDETYDLLDGDIRISGNDAVVDEASTYLSGLEQAQSGLFEISFLSSADSQDLVMARLAPEASIAPPPAVPLPASALLLIAGLGGFAVMRRR